MARERERAREHSAKRPRALSHTRIDSNSNCTAPAAHTWLPANHSAQRGKAWAPTVSTTTRSATRTLRRTVPARPLASPGTGVRPVARRGTCRSAGLPGAPADQPWRGTPGGAARACRRPRRRGAQTWPGLLGRCRGHAALRSGRQPGGEAWHEASTAPPTTSGVRCGATCCAHRAMREGQHSTHSRLIAGITRITRCMQMVVTQPRGAWRRLHPSSPLLLLRARGPRRPPPLRP